jgi:anti-sigma factor RsiW
LTRDTEQAYHQVVAMHFNACPVELEKVAEAHVMGLLPKEQAIAFEDHFAACDTCATVVYKIADYVGAMNAARRNVPWEPTN